MKGGQKATNDVWEGAHGLEWALPSPAPYHTWNEPPKVTFDEEPGEFDPHAAPRSTEALEAVGMNDDARRRSVRRWTIALVLVALAFYAGFILLGRRSRRG